ncbi:MAG: hypothetical protein U1F98_10905 [Verrucomicrobiota bacterium]
MINGKHVGTVGMDEDGLLFLKASWMRMKDAKGVTFPDTGEARFTISGLRERTDEHLEWFSKALIPGDKVEMELVQATVVDAPTRVERKPKT